MFLIANIIYDWKILLGFIFLLLVMIGNSLVTILPISSLTLLFTSIILWFFSVSATFFCLHKLLQKTEPLQFVVKTNKRSVLMEKGLIKPNSEKVKALVKDIDKYFISKWYANISQNQNFAEQSTALLEELIIRLAEVQISVSSKMLLHGSLNLVLRHFKEFRRTLKRKEKYGAEIEKLYRYVRFLDICFHYHDNFRYSHICSTGSKKAKHYFLHQLTTNLLRHFINSELWNSLPCSILVSILSRKLTSYVLNLSSHPDILNYLLLNGLASKSVRDNYNLDKYARISLAQYFDIIDGKNKNTVNVTLEDDLETTNEKVPDLKLTAITNKDIRLVRSDGRQVDQVTPVRNRRIETSKKVFLHKHLCTNVCSVIRESFLQMK